MKDISSGEGSPESVKGGGDSDEENRKLLNPPLRYQGA